MLTLWSNVFDDVMGTTFGASTSLRRFEPAVDVRMTGDSAILLFDIPGVKKEDLDITVSDRNLTVKGKRQYEEKGREQVVLGRAYGSFTRIYTLPEGVDPENLSAELTDGVLTIRVPKSAKALPRKIEIGGGSGPPKLE